MSKKRPTTPQTNKAPGSPAEGDNVRTTETEQAQVIVEYKTATFPGRHVPTGNEPDFVLVTRATRQGSKAQWYCAADISDERVQKFAAAIRQARALKQWNQTQAAEACGMSQPQWSNLEAGLIEPLPRKVFELERTLGLQPGELSAHLGYSAHGGDDRELFTQVAEKLDHLYIHGAWAVEEVMDRDSNPNEVQKFLEDIDKVGPDMIAALATVAQNLLDTMNAAVDYAMPKVFRMRQAEMKKLRRIISVHEPEPTPFDDDPF